MTDALYIFRTLTHHYEVNVHGNSYRLMTLSEFYLFPINHAFIMPFCLPPDVKSLKKMEADLFP